MHVKKLCTVKEITNFYDQANYCVAHCILYSYIFGVCYNIRMSSFDIYLAGVMKPAPNDSVNEDPGQHEEAKEVDLDIANLGNVFAHMEDFVADENRDSIRLNIDRKIINAASDFRGKSMENF